MRWILKKVFQALTIAGIVRLVQYFKGSDARR